MVDGMTVYGVKYPPARFSKMNNKQRQAVIELRRQYWNQKDGRSNNNNNSTMVAAMTAVQDEMSELENRIISAVSRGSNEKSDDQSQLTNHTAGNDSKRKASSGSIGSFLASQNKRGKKHN